MSSGNAGVDWTKFEKSGPVGLDDFKAYGVLGAGSFGRVEGVIKQTGETAGTKYAMKCFQKRQLIRSKTARLIRKELNEAFAFNEPYKHKDKTIDVKKIGLVMRQAGLYPT